jgi:hypothetical protein
VRIVSGQGPLAGICEIIESVSMGDFLINCISICEVQPQHEFSVVIIINNKQTL